MDAHFEALTDPTYLLINLFVIFGMICVFATFVFMMPIVGNVIAGVFTTVFGEQAMAKLRGRTSGTVNPHPEEQSA